MSPPVPEFAPPILAAPPVVGNGAPYIGKPSPPVELVPSGSPPALSAAQRDCVAKVRLTVRSSVENPNPQVSTPLESEGQAEVAIRNRSLSNF